jgi:hypothetical protein
MIKVLFFLSALITGIQSGIIIYGLGLVKYELAVGLALCLVAAAIVSILTKHYSELYIRELLKEKKL